MTKTKIALAALTVVAAAGAVFASKKANRIQANYKLYYITGTPAECTLFTLCTTTNSAALPRVACEDVPTLYTTDQCLTSDIFQGTSYIPAAE